MPHAERNRLGCAERFCHLGRVIVGGGVVVRVWITAQFQRTLLPIADHVKVRPCTPTDAVLQEGVDIMRIRLSKVADVDEYDAIRLLRRDRVTVFPPAKVIGVAAACDTPGVIAVNPRL